MANYFKLIVVTFILSVFCFLSEVTQAEHIHWDYVEQGETWLKDFKTCRGEMQSPIDLFKPMDKNSLGPVNFENYDDILKDPLLTNNGHTAQLSATDVRGKISKGFLLKNNKYKFIQMHFHWGSTDKKGSEHFVKGKQYPMEVHLVHQNEKYNLDKALQEKDGLAVVGVLFEISSVDNDLLSPIIDSLKHIKLGGNSTKVSKNHLKLEHFLPEDMSYMSYEGSLTTPSCNQVVTWTIFTNPLKISSNQLLAFRDIHFGNETSKHMQDNFRKLQDLNGRKILRYTSGGISVFGSCGSVTLLTSALCYWYSLHS